MTRMPPACDMDRYRPIPFYYITTADEKELDYDNFLRSLTVIKQQGYGGVVLFNRPPLGFTQEEYLTDKWFRMVENCLLACRQLGLKLWINDSYDCPAGAVGGKIKKIAPHLNGQRLFLENGKVAVRDVAWGFPAYEEPESSSLFIAMVYEAYKRRFGQYFGNTIAGFFTDADARRVNWEVLQKDSPMRGYFPWSRNFAAAFEHKFGYDIRLHLAEILAGRACPQAVDYWQNCSDLYFQWFANNYEWCRANGLEYTYHTSDTAPNPVTEENPYSSIYSQGRAPDSYCHCDYPGTDHEMPDLNGARLLSNTKDFVFPRASWCSDASRARTPRFFDVYGDLRAKQAQSAAFLYDRKGAMCEMYAAVGWGADKTMLRTIAAWQIMQGITFIVPQSYHYRLHGETKQFAPYSFSGYSLHIRALSDMMAEYACLADRGILEAALAVLDITEDVWAGKVKDSSLFLSVCKQLNRSPQGYIISDLAGIRRQAAHIRAVINPGLELGSERERILKALGLQVIDAVDLGRLDKLVPVGIRYVGGGTPHFMRRRLDHGGEMVLLANIENGEEISGTLAVGERKYDVCLESGEIAFFSEDFQKYREPGRPCGNRIPLPGTADVAWQYENMINIQRWVGDDGQPLPATGAGTGGSFILAARPDFEDIVCAGGGMKSAHLYFRFETAEVIPLIRLHISEKSMENVKSMDMDGTPIENYAPERIFDDRYRAYPLETASAAGAHTLRLHVAGALPGCDGIFLSGQFDADIQVENEYYDYCNATMGIQLYLPEFAAVKLSRRRKVLRTDLSWTEQGHPLYSGIVDYRFDMAFPENAGHAKLFLPEVGSDCSVYLDGKFVGTCVWKPYLFALGTLSGRHAVRIRVNNTLANLFECYRKPSGLLQGGYIEYEG